MKFCIRSPLSRHNIANTMQRLKRSVRLQKWLIETERLDEENEYNKKIYINSDWTPPGANKTIEYHMREFHANLKHELTKIKATSKKSSNHNDLELSAPSQCKKRKDIIFLQADKGLGPVLIPRDKYKKAILKMLSDKNSYKEITKEEAYTILRTAKSDLHDIFSYDSGHSLPEN